MKPAVVVYHKPENIDRLAILLARLENIPLLTSEMDVNKMILVLEKFGEDRK